MRDGFGVGLVASFDDVSIKLKSRTSRSYDIAESIYSSLPNETDAVQQKMRPLATKDLTPRRNTNDIPNLTAMQGGFCYGFKLKWFKLGVAVHLPLQDVAEVRFRYPDEREQYFTNRLNFSLIGNRAQRPAAAVAMGFRPLEWFGLGVGLDVHAGMKGTARMFVADPLDKDQFNLDLDAKLSYAFAAIAGVYFQPLSWMGIGASFRDRSYMPFDFTTELRFWNFSFAKDSETLRTKYQYAYSYSPREVRLGGNFVLEKWTLLYEVDWRQWSEYRVEEPSKTLIRNAQGGYEWQVGYGTAPGFEDIFIPRLGARYRPLTWLEVSLGGSYEPSPVPDQTGRTNYVDNARIHATAGAEFYLPWVEGLSLGTHFQAITLVSRSVTKSTAASNPVIDEFVDSRDQLTEKPLPESHGLQSNNPGFPGYSSQGWFGSAGVYLNYALP